MRKNWERIRWGLTPSGKMTNVSIYLSFYSEFKVDVCLQIRNKHHKCNLCIISIVFLRLLLLSSASQMFLLKKKNTSNPTFISLRESEETLPSCCTFSFVKSNKDTVTCKSWMSLQRPFELWQIVKRNCTNYSFKWCCSLPVFSQYTTDQSVFPSIPELIYLSSLSLYIRESAVIWQVYTFTETPISFTHLQPYYRCIDIKILINEPVLFIILFSFIHFLIYKLWLLPN